MNFRQGRRRGAPTLRSRLLLPVAAVALPLTILAAAVIYNSYRGDRERAEERLRQEVLALAMVVDREFGRVQAVLQTLAGSAALANGDLTGFEHEMRAASASLHGASVGLFDSDTRQLINTAMPLGQPRTDTRRLDIARVVIETGRATVSDVHRGMNSGEMTVAVMVPVFAAGPPGAAPQSGTPPGRVAYLLTAGVRSKALGVLLREQHLPPGWVGGILDRDFFVAARTSDADRFVGTRAIPALHAALVTGDSGVVRARRIDGVASTTVFARAPASGFFVALAAPDDVFETPLRLALWRLVAIGAAVASGGLALALLIARRLATSIESLAATGDAATRPGARLREVELVAERLARTAAQRDDAEAALRALADSLEAEVAERTEALAESEARLRGIFDAQLQLVALITTDGRRVEINRAASKLHGVDPREILGEPVWDAWWWRDNPEVSGENPRRSCARCGRRVGTGRAHRDRR